MRKIETSEATCLKIVGDAHISDNAVKNDRGRCLAFDWTNVVRQTDEERYTPLSRSRHSYINS